MFRSGARPRRFGWMQEDGLVLVAYLIMLREGIEAALIVGIVASYLKQTGRSRYMPAVWLGVVLALAICLALGYALTVTGAEFPQKQQEAFEGVVALVAVGVLTSMVFWMKKAARSIKTELHGSVDAALAGARTALSASSPWRSSRSGARGSNPSSFCSPPSSRMSAGAAGRCPSRRALGRGLRRRHHLWRRPPRSQALLPLDQRPHRLRGGGLAGRRVAGLPRGGALERAAGAGLRSQRRAAGRQRLGVLLTGMFGYQDAPTVGEVAGLPGVPRSRPLVPLRPEPSRHSGVAPGLATQH